MRPLPPKLASAHAKAVSLVQSTASIDDRWTLPRYKAVLAAAYLQADDLAAKKGGSMEDWLATRLGSPIAQKAVKAIDTEGARRGWPPGLLDLPPVASRALSTATAPTVPSTAAPGDVMHTQVGESIWGPGAAPAPSDGLVPLPSGPVESPGPWRSLARITEQIAGAVVARAGADPASTSAKVTVQADGGRITYTYRPLVRDGAVHHVPANVALSGAVHHVPDRVVSRKGDPDAVRVLHDGLRGGDDGTAPATVYVAASVVVDGARTDSRVYEYARAGDDYAMQGTVDALPPVTGAGVTGFLRANWPWLAGAGVVAFLVRR